MSVNNPPKLLGIILAMVLLSILFGMGRLTESGYIGLMGLLIGYLVGNGIAARNGEPVQPALGRTDPVDCPGSSEVCTSELPLVTATISTPPKQSPDRPARRSPSR